MPLQLVLIRHGESLGNRAGRMEGRQSTALTPQGWQQAQALGRSPLIQQAPPSHVYCSPALRATQTLQGLIQGANGSVTLGANGAGAVVSTGLPLDRVGPESPQAMQIHIAARRTPIPITWLAELQEYDNGVLAGLTWGEAQQAYPDLCRQLESTLDWVPIPGAETWTEGRDRARQAVQGWLRHHPQGDCLWVITHHWILQQLLAVVLGCDRTWGLTIPHTAVFEFWIDRDRWHHPAANRWNSELWQIKRFNDQSHLSPRDRGQDLVS